MKEAIFLFMWTDTQPVSKTDNNRSPSRAEWRSVCITCTMQPSAM